MADFLVRGLDKQLNIRFAISETTELVSEIVIRHDADPVASEVIAEATAGCALLAVLLEGEEKYSVRWEYPGAVKGIIADVDAAGRVRCLPQNPHAANDVSDREDVYGTKDGSISVVKTEDGRILNSGKTKAPLADAADDLAFFFSISDQIETEIVTLATLNPSPSQPIKLAAGIMLQAMPQCNLEEFSIIRERLHSSAVREALADEAIPFELRMRKILSAVFGVSPEEQVDRFSYSLAVKPFFACSCSKAKMLTSLKMLGDEELKAMFAQNGSAKVQCRFCCQTYEFFSKDFPNFSK